MRILLTVTLILSVAEAPSLPAAAAKFVPGVRWRPKSALIADFSCRGHREQAILGMTAKDIVVAVFLNGLTEKPEVLRYSAEARDPKSLKLTIESLDYDPKEDIGDLPGFQRSRSCQGLNLSDEKVDAAHIYWNHETGHFADWVR
jgi:hypothetical protein